MQTIKYLMLQYITMFISRVLYITNLIALDPLWYYSRSPIRTLNINLIFRVLDVISLTFKFSCSVLLGIIVKFLFPFSYLAQNLISSSVSLKELFFNKINSKLSSFFFFVFLVIFNNYTIVVNMYTYVYTHACYNNICMYVDSIIYMNSIEGIKHNSYSLHHADIQFTTSNRQRQHITKKQIRDIRLRSFLFFLIIKVYANPNPSLHSWIAFNKLLRSLS